MSTSDDLRKLADRFSAGWHDGIKIDASDVMLLTDAAAEIERLLSESDERLKNTVAQEMEIERLRKGLSEVEFLIKESAGVYGLVCDEQAKEPECPERATYCAEAIRALKEQP